MDYGSSIEAEKAKAMSRYRRIQKFARIWWLVEVIVALTLLITFPLIRLPISTDTFSNFTFRRFAAFILNPHINFIVGIAIIAVLFLLSRGNGAGIEVSTDGYLDWQEETASIVEIGTDFPPYCPAPVAEEKVSGDVESEDVEAKLNCEAVSNAIEDATKQIRRFERTLSEKLKRELRTKQREKFRRSESEIAVRGGGREVESVDELSSEEFRRRIETFIENEKHQRSVRAPKMAEEIF